jgi:hypothetical protein
MKSTQHKLAFSTVILAGICLFATGCGTKVSQVPVSTVPNAAPSVLTLSPTFAIGGSPSQTVTVTGTGFLGSSSVTYNGSQHAATLISSQQLSINLSQSDLATPGNYQIVVTNPTPGGGTAPAIFQVWQTLSDTTTGMSFSMPVFGNSTSLTSDILPSGEGHVLPYVHSNNTNVNDSPFGFHVFPNPSRLNLVQWFGQNIDINGQLFAAGSYKQQNLSDGSVMLMFNPTVGLPDAYIEANDGNIQLSAMYRITASGQIVSLFLPQEPFPNSDLNGIPADGMGTIDINALGSVHF